MLHPSAPLGPSNSAPSPSCPEDAAAADDSVGQQQLTGQFQCQTASHGLLFFPAEGGKTPSSSWRLQDIPLPSEVPYIDSSYLSHSLQQAEGASMSVVELQSLSQHLGLLACPVQGSDALQAAVDAGDRWQPLLLMLNDIWSSSYRRHQDQKLLQQQLQDMAVSQRATALCMMSVVSQHLHAQAWQAPTQPQTPFLQRPACYSICTDSLMALKIRLLIALCVCVCSAGGVQVWQPAPEAVLCVQQGLPY